MHLKCIYGILPWEKRPDDYEKLIDRETDMMMAGYTPFHVAEVNMNFVYINKGN